jgi:hypothetical protein
VNDPVAAGYDPTVADVFTDVVRDKEMRNQYLQAYAAYHHWDSLTYERVLQKVKEVTLVPAPARHAAMFPSDEDFEIAALVSSMTYTQDPSCAIEFRIVQLGDEQDTVVSYGFKGSALEEIKEAAQNHLDVHLAEEASIDYLQHVCPAVPVTTESAACSTHPEYFLWPSDRFFIHHRAP